MTDPRKQGRNNRRRGANLERESVNQAREHGLQAERWDITGAADERGDIEIEDRFYGCKRKKSIPAWLIPEKQEQGVIFRGERDIARIAIPYVDFLDLLQVKKMYETLKRREE